MIAGNLDDLRNRTIGDLRRDRRRLIMLRDVDSLSTYTDAGNATLNGDSIVEGFGAVLRKQLSIYSQPLEKKMPLKCTLCLRSLTSFGL